MIVPRMGGSFIENGIGAVGTSANTVRPGSQARIKRAEAEVSGAEPPLSRG
jgi:hypothetical protein